MSISNQSKNVSKSISIEEKQTKIQFKTVGTSSSLLLLTITWQYGLWSFQTGGTKLKRFLPKNQYAQRKLLNFEGSWGVVKNWASF